MSGVRVGDYLKVLDHIPGWSSYLGREMVTSEADAYEKVEIYQRCVDKISKGVKSIPTYFDDEPVEEVWPLPIPYGSLVEDTAKHILLYGAGYWLKLNNVSRVVKSVQVLQANEVQAEPILEDGGRPVLKDGKPQYTFRHYGLEWPQEQVVFFRLFHPRREWGAGLAPGRTGLLSAKKLHILNLFETKFFDEGGLGPILIDLPPGVPDAERERIESALNRTITKMWRAFKAVALEGRGEREVHQLMKALKDLGIEEARKAARSGILDAFDVPEGLIVPNANRASAEVHEREFINGPVIALADMMVGVINEQLFNGRKRLRTAVQELLVNQDDESRRSGALINLRNAGMPMETSLAVLGYNIPTDADGNPLPIEEENALTPRPPLPQGEGENRPGTIPIAEGEGEEDEPEEIKAELGLWRKKAIRDVERGRKRRAFETQVIPGNLRAYLEGGLETAQTIEQVKGVFDGAIGWVGYP